MSMVVLRGAQSIGLGPHLSTFTSRKSLNICTWSSSPYTVTEKLLYIIKGPMKVISGFLPETWGYFCMENFISTTRNCHSHIHESTHFILFAFRKVHPRFLFPRLACGPPKLMGHGEPPRLLYFIVLFLICFPFPLLLFDILYLLCTDN